MPPLASAAAALARVVSRLGATLARWLLTAVAPGITPSCIITMLPARLLLPLMRCGIARGGGVVRVSRLETRHNLLLYPPAYQALDRREKWPIIRTDQ